MCRDWECLLQTSASYIRSSLMKISELQCSEKSSQIYKKSLEMVKNHGGCSRNRKKRTKNFRNVSKIFGQFLEPFIKSWKCSAWSLWP